jgi:CHAT domain-containing protein/tetratricopeptide (TPR) repeat protein
MNPEHDLTVSCRECGTPLMIKCPEIDVIHFPVDDKKVVQLFSGRLHVNKCPACSTGTSVFVPLIVMHEDLARLLVAVPQSVSAETRQLLKASLADAGHDMKVTVCHDYVELYTALAAWVNEILIPFLQVFLQVDGVNTNIDPDQITPLILRLFHSQAEALIEPFIKMEQSGRSLDGRDLLRQMHVSLVLEVLTHLRREAIRTKTLSQLEDAFRSRVPLECIVDEVIEQSRSDCPSELVAPMETPVEFRKAFIREYSNAVLHAYCDQDNPRAAKWAGYLRMIWLLGKRSDVTLDPQFHLPAEVIRRTARFSDLFESCGVSPTEDIEAFKSHMSDRHEMLKAYGFAQDEARAVASGMIRIHFSPPDVPRAIETTALLEQTILKTLDERMPLNTSEEHSEEYGLFAGMQLRNFAKSGHIMVGKRVAESALNRAIAAADSVAAITTATSSMEALNLLGEYTAAADFASRILKHLDDLATGVPRIAKLWRLLLNFFNESGNVCRYLRRFDQSLDTYLICETLIEKIPDEKDRPRLWAILRCNQARVYREMGRYRQARDLFEAQIAATPNDEALLNSAAALALETGDHGGAKRYIDRALEVTAHRVLPEDRAALFLTRGVIRLNALEDVTGGIEDLSEAFAGSQRGAQQVAIRAAATVVRHSLAIGTNAPFVRHCVEWLEERLREDVDRSARTEMVLNQELSWKALIVTVLAEHHLALGSVADAEARLQKELALLDRYAAQMPWQFNIVRSRMHHVLRRFDLSAAHLSAAMESIDREVPTGDNSPFALGWMYDKREFQEVVGRLALDLSDRGFLVDNDLVDVYEFLNGREIGARLQYGSDSHSTAEQLAIRLSRIERKLLIVWFVEGGDQVRLAYLSSDHPAPPLLRACSFVRTEIEAIKKRVHSTVNALGPQSLTEHTDGLRDWNGFAATLGQAIAPLLQPGCQVCFLPGRTLTGLPLHLATLPNGRTLIEDHPILSAPNFAVMLTDRPSSERREFAALVMVTKKDDSDDFKRHAQQASEALVRNMGGTGRVLFLSEETADRAAVLATFPQASEIVFLCHGANAGARKGVGICIADRGDLPPAFLPIEEVPELKRFLLCWDDLEEIQASPELVVSIACSSGLTAIGHAGTRHGLEQILFAKGTRAIVSPLWDVDQEESLRWLQAFIEIRMSGPGRSLVEAHRLACLKMQAKAPNMHPTMWGAFVVSGSLSI